MPSQMTAGMSGAELKSLSREAAMRPMREYLPTYLPTYLPANTLIMYAIRNWAQHDLLAHCFLAAV
jgi:hypothetical protein